jgi:hypothetical protein
MDLDELMLDFTEKVIALCKALCRHALDEILPLCVRDHVACFN